MELRTAQRGWLSLSPPHRFSTARLWDAPEAAVALNAHGAPHYCPDGPLQRVGPLPALLSRVLGCDLERTLSSVWPGVAVVLVSIQREPETCPLVSTAPSIPPSLAYPPNALRVRIRDLTGHITEMYVKHDADLDALKHQIQLRMSHTPADRQQLIFQGAQLAGNHQLSDYGVTQDAIIHLMMRLRGGRGDNFSMVCWPDEAELGAFQSPVQISISIEDTSRGRQYPGPQDLVRLSMDTWASHADGFQLTVELLPRLAWSPPDHRGGLCVWHADVLLALACSLSARGLPPEIVRLITRFAALPPQAWFDGRPLAGRTAMQRTEPEVEGEGWGGLSAVFTPAVPLPAIGRFRVSGPARSGGYLPGSREEDSEAAREWAPGFEWPRTHWCFELSGPTSGRRIEENEVTRDVSCTSFGNW